MSQAYLNGYFEPEKSESGRGGRDISNDIVVVACLLMIIALMILPLPLFIIDMLVAFNITFALVLILSAVYIRTAIDFTIFPSILLVSTLMRLALSVATTRMILIEGEAGDIIQTFGSMVTGSNIVVGLVVFLIITVVQFIVIAKGSERVAEVSARFSLDGMPGKQMSIDSDLRSGLITKEEARAKRAELEVENRLHGSLDGAMKFVKGDAIASIIIILINLLGGLAVGVLQNGMEVGAAMSKYSILTVGDGLVAQIPALLSALAAGLIVTRTSQREDGHLGKAISAQLSGRPRVFLIVGVGCFGMALIPGFPTTVFLVLAVVNICIGLFLQYGASENINDLKKRTRTMLGTNREQDHIDIEIPTPRKLEATDVPFQPVIPLLLEINMRHATRQDLEHAKDELRDLVDRIQVRIGMQIPGINIFATDLPDGMLWRLNVYEMSVKEFKGNSFDLNALSEEIENALIANCSKLFGIQNASNLLNLASESLPDLVNDVIRNISVPQLHLVLQSLLEEGISIRDIRTILETLARFEGNLPSPQDQIESVRISLARYITRQYSTNGNIDVIRIKPEFEQLLTEKVETAPGIGAYLALNPAQVKQLTRLVSTAAEKTGARIIMTNMRLRRPLWSLLSYEIRDIHLVSYNEILPDTNVRDVISITGEEHTGTEMASPSDPGVPTDHA
ncbi:MAG: flagellar biosynthesis protein FlhA [Aquisalinus sp.]|nr:flagellar biosynthesis protein FlhA [Aquisalinus sp.]